MQSGLFPHVLVYGMCCVSGFVVFDHLASGALFIGWTTLYPLYFRLLRKKPISSSLIFLP